MTLLIALALDTLTWYDAQYPSHGMLNLPAVMLCIAQLRVMRIPVSLTLKWVWTNVASTQLDRLPQNKKGVRPSSRSTGKNVKAVYNKRHTWCQTGSPEACVYIASSLSCSIEERDWTDIGREVHSITTVAGTWVARQVCAQRWEHTTNRKTRGAVQGLTSEQFRKTVPSILFSSADQNN